MKRALPGAAAAAAALVLAVAGSAATLPGGTSISATITSPATGAVYPQGSAVTVSGTASVGQGVQAQNTTIVYIVDVSGSTDAVTSTNCPNSTVYKSIGNTTLDCEVTAVRAVNRQAVLNGNVAAVGLIAFGGCPNTCGSNTNGTQKGTTADAAAVDLDPGTAIATLAPPNAGPPPSLIYRFPPNNNLEALLQSAYVNNDATVLFGGWPTPVISPAQDGFTEFNQPGGTHVGANTNYWAAMMELDTLAHSITTPKTVVIFVSDGDSNTTGPNGEVVSNAINTIKTDPNIHTSITAWTFGMGAQAHCVAPSPNAGTMQDIAAAFGGTCTPLADPSGAAQAAPALIQSHLSSVSYTADGNASTPSQAVTATGPGSAPFTHSFSGLANGPHHLCATAHGSDSSGSGDSDPACVDVTLQAPPTITLTGGDQNGQPAGDIPEGGSFSVGATVDSQGTTTAAWSEPTGHCTFLDPSSLNTSVTCDDGNDTYALTLTVTDNATPAQTATATEHLKVENVAPAVTTYTVTPGAVSLLGTPGPTVHAHAEFTDPGADTWSCTIQWGDGTTDTVSGAGHVCDADHTFASAGNFPTHLEVTDGDGGFGEGNQGVTVQAPAQLTLPTGSAGGPAGTVPEASPFAIHGSSDELLASVVWSASGGDGTCSFGPATLDTSVTCTDEGLYHITVVATDAYGQTSSGGFDLQVTDVAPSAALTLSQTFVPLNQSVHADVAITDPGADQWSCTIDWGDGSTSTTAPSSSKSCSGDHAYGTGGSYTVKATVDDQDGNTGTDSQGLVVKGLPTFSGLPADGTNGSPAFDKNEGQAFTITGSVAGATALQWSDASGHCSFAPANALPTTVTCDDGPGLYALVLTATDQFGQSAQATLHAKIENVAPTLTINAPNPGSSGRVVLFTATVTDPGVLDTPKCTIDWGDGTVDTNVPVSGGFCSGQHTYAGTAQSATIAAFATDKDGASSPVKTVSLTFNRPPICINVHADITTLWPADHRLVLVTLSGATDPDTGDTLTYAISSVTQDEPLLGLGSGDTSPDAKPASGGSVWLRAERDGTGNGRVYTITYTVTDSSGAGCAGGGTHTVTVSVPHDTAHAAVKSGTQYNSFG